MHIFSEKILNLWFFDCYETSLTSITPNQQLNKPVTTINSKGDWMFSKLKKGLEIGGLQLDVGRIDPEKIPFVSHAHSDHIPSGNGTEVVADPVTLDLMNYFLKKRRKNYVEYTLMPEEKLKGNVEEVEFFSAGHIIGSKMIRFEKNEKKILYTGDIALKKTYNLKGADIPKSDIMIIESTYGLPQYEFPDPKEVGKEIVDWVKDETKKGKTVFLYGYKLGKAQQLCSLLQKNDIPYSVDDTVFDINNILSKYGYEFNGALVNGSNEQVIVCPGSFRKTEKFRKIIGRSKGIKQAFATGWATDERMSRVFKADEIFPLSDHADFNDLIKAVKISSPSVVYTHHGHADYLAKEITKQLGIYSYALE